MIGLPCLDVQGYLTSNIAIFRADDILQAYNFISFFITYTFYRPCACAISYGVTRNRLLKKQPGSVDL